MINHLKDQYSISRLCRVLECSRSGYYDWVNLGRPQHKSFKQPINDLVNEMYQLDNRWGIKSIRMKIKTIYGEILTNYTVYRYMRLNDLQSVIRKKKRKYAKTQHHSIPNLLQRNFTTEQPNTKWSIDITYLPYDTGTLYLCAMKDMCDKSIVAYEIDCRQEANIVLKPVEQILKQIPQDQRKSLIIHSDQGVQFISDKYQALLKKYHVTQSVSYKGSCVDNVPIESFFSALKSETIHLHKHITREQMVNIVNNYITYYNNHRLQEQLKELAPNQYRQLALNNLF